MPSSPRNSSTEFLLLNSTQGPIPFDLREHHEHICSALAFTSARAKLLFFERFWNLLDDAAEHVFPLPLPLPLPLPIRTPSSSSTPTPALADATRTQQNAKGPSTGAVSSESSAKQECVEQSAPNAGGEPLPVSPFPASPISDDASHAIASHSVPSPSASATASGSDSDAEHYKLDDAITSSSDHKETEAETEQTRCMRAVVCTTLVAGVLGYAPPGVLRRVEAYATRCAGMCTGRGAETSKGTKGTATGAAAATATASLSDFGYLFMGFFRSNSRPVDYALFDALTHCIERLYPASAPPTAVPFPETLNLSSILKVCVVHRFRKSRKLRMIPSFANIELSRHSRADLMEFLMPTMIILISKLYLSAFKYLSA